MNATAQGQRWRRIDLHVHTPASSDYVGPPLSPDEFAEAVAGIGVDAFAVTDHNSAEWVDEIASAASRHGVVVFPGVELTVTGGKEGSVHLIAIFDVDASTKVVEGLLAKLDLPAKDFGTSEACSPKSAEEAIQIIRQSGALPVLPHADSSKGVLHDMKGQPRIRVMNLPELAAVEVKNVEKCRRLLDGTDKNYKQKLAVYRASDNRAGGDSGHDVCNVGSRFSYFKMDVINLEALRQCFCDPDVRIRTDADVEDFSGAPGPHISAVSVSKGFLKGRYELHEGLNCIIGGKGVGKSLLIELIRFALDQPSSVDAIVDDQELKLERLLKTGGVVSVEFTTAGGQHLVAERTYEPAERPIVVRDLDTDELVEGDVSEIFPITAYSQTEAIEIARDPDAQLRLIDSMLNLAPTRREIRNVVRELEESDHQIIEATAACTSLKAVNTDLATVEQQLKDLEKLLESKEYEDYKATEPRSSALSEIAESYDQLEQALSAAADATTDLEPWEIPEWS